MENMGVRKSEPPCWEKTISTQVPALMRAIEEMSFFLAEQRADPVALQTAQFAVEEMGTNVIKYGFDDAGEHFFTLRARCREDHIELSLLDSGHAFDPCTLPEPNPDATLDERTPGGWGISLVRRMVAEMLYERTDTKNVLTLRIRQGGPVA